MENNSNDNAACNLTMEDFEVGFCTFLGKKLILSRKYQDSHFIALSPKNFNKCKKNSTNISFLDIS